MTKAERAHFRSVVEKGRPSRVDIDYLPTDEETDPCQWIYWWPCGCSFATRTHKWNQCSQHAEEL